MKEHGAPIQRKEFLLQRPDCNSEGEGKEEDRVSRIGGRTSEMHWLRVCPPFCGPPQSGSHRSCWPQLEKYRRRGGTKRCETQLCNGGEGT
eukprot:5752155-Pyramimonas_sp.AAC.1